MNGITLNIGESAYIKKSAFASTWEVVYAGMINERIYSVAITYGLGYNSMAYNLYLPISQREIYTKKGKVIVHDISPTRINISIERR